MSSKADKRKALFSRYSKNLNLIKPFLTKVPKKYLNSDVVICPFCHKYFSAKHLTKEPTVYLTIEHAPPGALKGKPVVLTCSRCNNSSGILLDKVQKEDVEFNQVLHSVPGKKTVHARHIFVKKSDEGISKRGFYGKMSFDESGSTVFVPMGPDMDQEYLKNFFESGERSINFQGKMPNKRLARIAYIRNAYLLAFQRLGYGYILSPPVAQFRQQLRKPKSKLFPVFTDMDKPPFDNGIYEVVNPKELQGLFVAYSLKSKYGEIRKGVMLPSPRTDLNIYFSKLIELGGQGNISLGVNNIDSVDFLTDPSHALSIYRSKKFAWNR